MAEETKRKRDANGTGCVFKPGSRLPAKLRAAGDETGARKAEARLARTSWYIGYTVSTGNTRTECAKTFVKAEADSLLERRKAAIGLGEGDPRAQEKRLVQELLQDVLLDYKANGRSTAADAEIRVRKHLGPAFGAIRAVRLSNAHSQQYILDRVGQGAALATVANELSLLRRAMKLGVQNRKLAVAPYVGLPSGFNVARTGFLDVPEYRALQSHLPSQLKAIVSLAFHSAMRKGELLGIKWSQVDLAEGFIRLTAAETKTRQARTIPIAAEPLALLRMERIHRDATELPVSGF